jgi:hypothetical protein
MSPERLSRRVRAALTGLAAAMLSCLILLLSAVAAQAESYRFWGYYHWSGSGWEFYQFGPDQVTPTDGSVEGWRFAVTGEAAPRPPRTQGDFELICGATPAEQGAKRVAVVIDYGTEADADGGTKPAAPRGACAVVPPAATGAEVLSAVSQQRVEGGLVCALDGYPATGCGGLVEQTAPTGPEKPVTLALPPGAGTASPEPTTTSAAEADDDESSIPVVIGIAAAAAAVVALVVGATMQSRRSRRE